MARPKKSAKDQHREMLSQVVARCVEKTVAERRQCSITEARRIAEREYALALKPLTEDDIAKGLDTHTGRVWQSYSSGRRTMKPAILERVLKVMRKRGINYRAGLDAPTRRKLLKAALAATSPQIDEGPSAYLRQADWLKRGHHAASVLDSFGDIDSLRRLRDYCDICIKDTLSRRRMYQQQALDDEAKEEIERLENSDWPGD